MTSRLHVPLASRGQGLPLRAGPGPTLSAPAPASRCRLPAAAPAVPGLAVAVGGGGGGRHWDRITFRNWGQRGRGGPASHPGGGPAVASDSLQGPAANLPAAGGVRRGACWLGGGFLLFRNVSVYKYERTK